MLSLHQLKLEILRSFAQKQQHINKYNLLGKAPAQGELESNLRLTFDADQRWLALQAFDELKAAGYIRPTLTDLVSPEDWYEITDAGNQALAKGCADDLDIALSKIDLHLVEIRRGAWAAFYSKRPDSLRQAAHSARELIDQALKTGAPDADIKAQPGFVADKSSKTGVTRRMRVKFLLKKLHGSASDSDLDVVEAAADLVDALSRSLTGTAHLRAIPLDQELKDAIAAAEVALRRILQR